MKRRHVAILGLAVITTIGALTQGARILSRLREQQIAREHQAAQLEQQLATQRLEHDRLQNEIGVAEQQLAKLSASKASGDSAGSLRHDAQIKAWLGRVKQLKQTFDERPDQLIPEMRSLPDSEWLRLAKNAPLDSDENLRKALAAVRTAAKIRFGRALEIALRKFVAANNGERPATSAVFASFFENPADADALERYEISDGNPLSRPANPPNWSVRERTPVDADYDSRPALDSRGGATLTGAPWAWIPNFREQMTSAAKAYSAANPGTNASGVAPLLPYFNPPLDPALVKKLIKAESEQQF